MNLQSGQKYIALSVGGRIAGNNTPYLIYEIKMIYTIDRWIMVDYIESPLNGGVRRVFTNSLSNIMCSVLEPLTPETLIKYTTLQDMCWSGLTHNMALDLWDKGYRKV